MLRHNSASRNTISSLHILQTALIELKAYDKERSAQLVVFWQCDVIGAVDKHGWVIVGVLHDDDDVNIAGVAGLATVIRPHLPRPGENTTVKKRC